MADLHRLRGDEVEAERVLRQGLERHPDREDLLLALGLSLVRQGRHEAALEPLARAASIRPEVARFGYVYALALHSIGRTDRALEVLQSARARHPADRPLLYALATIRLEAGLADQALASGRELERIAPGDPQVRRLREQIEPLAGRP